MVVAVCRRSRVRSSGCNGSSWTAIRPRPLGRQTSRPSSTCSINTCAQTRRSRVRSSSCSGGRRNGLGDSPPGGFVLASHRIVNVAVMQDPGPGPRMDGKSGVTRDCRSGDQGVRSPPFGARGWRLLGWPASAPRPGPAGDDFPIGCRAHRVGRRQGEARRHDHGDRHRSRYRRYRVPGCPVGHGLLGQRTGRRSRSRPPLTVWRRVTGRRGPSGSAGGHACPRRGSGGTSPAPPRGSRSGGTAYRIG